MNNSPLVYDLSIEQLEKAISDFGESRYRAFQIWEGIYKNYWSESDKFTNLPKNLRINLNSSFTFSHLNPKTILESKDKQTHKTLFQLPDMNTVETVMMGYENRKTICISSQAGCAMGCVFCATGQIGFKRNLSSGEIIEQVLYYARRLHEDNKNITNIVIMGMGEPFHNYEATIEAIKRLNQPNGMHFGYRRFTISTVGIIPGIKLFIKEKIQVNLAISLHAANDELRSSLIPINKKYPLEDLLGICLDYVNQSGRRISFEWALIDGINDSIQDAVQLVNLLKPFLKNGNRLCHVNLIPLNPTKRFQGSPSLSTNSEKFRLELEKHKIPCSIRMRRGIDIQAGCGQLAGDQVGKFNLEIEKNGNE